MNHSSCRASAVVLIALVVVCTLILYRRLPQKHSLKRPVVFRKQLRDFVSSSNVLEAFDCTPYGWNYSLSLAKYDVRASLWWDDVQRVKIYPGMQVFTDHLCGYGIEETLPIARNGEVFIDVGANIGQSLLPYASKGWIVYAFEPMAHNLEVLRANIGRNRFTNVHLLQYAASNRTGTTKIFVPTGREDNAAMAGAAVADMNVKTKRVRVETVNVSTVDRVLFSIQTFHPGKVKRIKIDTQGHEIEVLGGMKSVLKSFPDDGEIMLEYSDKLQKAAGHSGQELISRAHSLGFNVYCGASCVHGDSAKCLDITLRKKASERMKPC